MNQQSGLYTGQESFLAPTMRLSSSQKLGAGTMANQSLWTEPTQWQRREEKWHEDAQLHKEHSWGFGHRFLGSKDMGEQQESPIVMSRSIVHLRVLIPNPNR